MNDKKIPTWFLGILLFTGPAISTLPAQPLFPNRTFISAWNSRNFVTGDFDSDGIQDLAGTSVTSQPNDVSIVFGNGDGTFSARVTFPTGAGPISLAKGDFNRDGKEDLVTVHGSPTPFDTGEFCSLLGNGDGTFNPPVCFQAGQSPRFLVVGEFNTDGELDVVVLNNGAIQDLFVFLGNGDGTFTLGTSVPVTDPSTATIADFDNDGNQDLAVTQPTLDTLTLLLGEGDGAFGTPSTLQVGDIPDWVVSGDFDEDGNPDLVSANANSDDLSVFLGNGDGSFAPEIRIPAGDHPETIVVGDLNADFHLDLAVTLNLSNEVLLLFGKGDGGFTPRLVLPAQSFPSGIGITELNGDGIPDLAVANNMDVSVYLGAGDGTFPISPRVLKSSVFGSQSVAAGDLNSDGVPDLAVGDGTILTGNGDFTFFRSTFSPGADFIIIDDFNGDGIPDIAGTQFMGTAFVILGNGDGTFGPDTSSPVGNEPEGLAGGDFNGDGNRDLAVANTQSLTVSVLLGNGDGSFAPQVQYSTGTIPKDVVVDDFNFDGNQDLAVANRGVPYSISVLLGNGDGTFQPEVRFDTIVVRPGSIALADFNQDGFQDLVVGSEGESRVAVLFGHGDGTFDTGIPSPTGIAGIPISVSTGDFDGDGIVDIVASNWNSQDVTILLGNGDGTFQERQEFVSSHLPWEVAVADFNLDGRPDLVTANIGPHVTVLPNGVDFLGCLDGDGDGFGATGRVSCSAGAETDCDDTDPAVNPAAQEIEDGIDNDCDGLVDELEVQATCDTLPDTLNLQSQGTAFSFSTTLTSAGTGQTLDPSLMAPAYISRVYSPFIGEQFEIVLPTPRAEPSCDDFTEDGIWETIEDRSVNGSGSATLRFNTPSDGQCETMDGNRQDINALLLDVVDGRTIFLCYTSSYPGALEPFECCDPLIVKNRGNR